MKPSLEEYWDFRRSLWTDMAKKLAIPCWPDPIDAPGDDVTTLGACMSSAGIRHFTAKEATTPHQAWPSALLPPACAWLSIIVLATVADRMRELVGRPIKMRNWWRPEDYNRDAAKGAPGSDHLWACAVDLDFTGNWLQAVAGRRAAQKLVQTIIPRNLLSLGVGWTVLHVGFAAPETLRLGHRRWKYGKLPPAEKSA